MKVEIKERRLPTGNRSLYLEYYETGFRKKEYLGIFLVPEDSARARRLNGEAATSLHPIPSTTSQKANGSMPPTSTVSSSLPRN